MSLAPKRKYHISGFAPQGENGPAAMPPSHLAPRAPAPLGGVELLYVDDIVRLLGGRKSAWWVRNHFAREDRLKIGRSVAWLREAAERWIRERRLA